MLTGDVLNIINTDSLDFAIKPIFLRRSLTRACWVEIVEVTEVAMKSLPIVIEPLQGTRMRAFRKFLKDVDSQTPSYDIDSGASTFDEPRPVHAADVVIYM